MPTFRRVGQTNLYTEVIESGPNQTPNHGPLAYYIPPSASILPPLISMDQAWNWFKYSSLWPGYFLFFEAGRTIPGASRSDPSPELTALLQQLDQAVPPMRVRTATGFGWVQGDPMDAQSVSIQFLETGWDPIAGQPNQRAISSQRFVQELTYHQVGLVIGEAMLITLDADERGFSINHQRSATNAPTDRGLLQRDPPPGPSQNIWIHGADGVKIDKVGRTLTLPLFGEDRGAMEVPLESLVQADFQPNALDSALYYFGPGASQDQFQALRFPVVDLNVNGASAATTTEIDLEVNLYGAQPEHSYFDYGVGQGGDGGGGRGTAQNGGERPVLGSFLRTYDGHNIHVAPTTNSRLTGTTKPNNGVWGNYPTQLGPLLYFSPHGSFELVMDDPVPAESWILGGFAGTEYISFTPRNGTPGDVVTFYPHEPAYAPKFGSTTPSSGGDLLTLDQRTSWVSVESYPEEGNAPPIQYFAQPDDAPLFGTDTVGSTNPYLVFKAIPANNLPVPADGTGLDSFPLAPFSGINAPDPLVDETVDVATYRSYEQTVLSPQRKERISSVAQTTRASASGRTLEQAGNENTTTPQGILATINGSDFMDITLADNEDLLLKLDQISDQFQDSLQTNRLFLPITKGDTIHWPDINGAPANYMTIEDWPFQVEVGGLPSGIESAGDNFYNVLIFKYYDRTLSDLLEDTSLWSQPGHYNTDPTALQDWIKTFIADTKTRAQDPELAPLYANFLDIVDNPNWNGIVALNVSLPLTNLPTEVQGLLSGIKHLDRFVAHHFGINVSKISPDASKIDRSSLFGLIDYVDDELHPSDADFDFRVGLLQVLFANTEIASFDAKIYVKLNLLFDEPATLTDNNGNPVPGNEVELIGTYENKDGEATYSFTFEGDDEFVLDPNSPALAAVSIKDAEFVTISGPDPNDFTGGQPQPIISEFQFAGDLRFVDNEDFDFFSYEAIGFTGLTLGVTSTWAQDSTDDWIPVQPADFVFSAFNVSLDGKSATVRPDSLFANFPLVLADFTVASLTFSLSSLGYIPVPGIVPGTNPVLAPKYSLEYNLSLGTQGVMVTVNPGFALKLLVGWTPSTSDKGGVATGFKFPLVSGGGSTLGIQGVLQLSLTDLGFVKMSEIIDGVDTNMYAFFLNSAALHVLGVQIPPGGSFSMALFVPESQSSGIDLSNLGWFVAYSADSASTTAAPPLPPVLPGPPAQIASGPDIQVVAAVAVPKKSGEITSIEIFYTLRNNGPTDANDFEVHVNRILPFAAPYGPTYNQSPTYSLASGDRIRRSVVWDNVPDGTHRFEVTAVFSGDENATNDGQVTNAVSVAAPAPSDPPVFKLDYLGIGQRVGFPTGTAAFGSVETAITGMGSIIPAGLGSDALVAHLKNIYDPNGGWLIAFDFTLFEVLRLAFIFDERDEMYGVLIGFAKGAPGPLKGFKFQILYKKVSDSVGVYMLDLTLPDIIRQWQFGTVAITLPNIGIDIYTNGDFKVDVGFPAGFDFSRSFNVQFQAGPLPIIGYGGFYFAVLSTATSKTIPQLKANSTAQFNPVLEAGFGLSVGLGKTIEKGILRAGATITIEGILEGTVAWYIPPDGATSAIVEDGMTRALEASFAALTGPPDYFRIKGQVQIVGRIYGKVDFGIVSAGVSLVAKAGVAITFESYGDLVFLLYAEVTATASITIAFVTIDFSFSLKIKFEFTVENFMGDAPWQPELASGTSARVALQGDSPLANTPIAWVNQDVDGAKKPVTVYLAPQMVPVNGQAHLVAGLLITKGGSPSTEFEDLVEDLLRWTVGLASDSTAVDPAALTVAGLQEILNRMSPPATPTTLARQSTDPLNFEKLQEFLNTNFTFSLGNASTLDAATASVTVFPMVPDLELTYGPSGGSTSTVDFATHNDRDEDYEDNLAEYFAALLADFEAKTQASALRAMLQASSHSMAEIVFQDYFAFLIKSGIDQMQQQLEADGSANKPVADLIAEMRAAGRFETVAATVARYFLHGLQLPADPTELAAFDPNNPSTIPDNIEALYSLTGQQVPVSPATDADDGAPIWSASLTPGSSNVLFPSGTSATHTFTTADATEIANVGSAEFPLATIETELPPTVDDTAREFAFRDYIELAGGAANARLYPFSDAFQTLVANEAADGNNVTANVYVGTPNNQPILTGEPVSDWSWALSADLTVQRFPSDTGGEPLANVYQLGGTDQITRNVIANIIEAGPAIATIRLLYAPEEGGGLVYGPDQGVTLLKTNLSTVTAPPRELLQATGAGIFTASITDTTDFLTLVWQVSVVNAGGFYLHVDGDGIPDHVFGEGSDPAPITLLVEFADDSTVSNYANALAITSEIPDGSHPYVNTPDIPAWFPSAAPGSVPFVVKRGVPDGEVGSVAENLYNLLTYWLAGDSVFNETIHGLAVSPTDPESGFDGNWYFNQTMPVARYSAAGGGNPYAGVGQTTNISFAFLDVFGNPMPIEGNGNLPALPVTILYFDPLIGITQWPSIESSHIFNDDGTLGAKLVFSGSGFVQAAGETTAAYEARVEAALDKYLQVQGQLSGVGVSARLETSIAPGISTDATAALDGFVATIIGTLQDQLGSGTPATDQTLDLSLAISTDARNAVAANIQEVEVFVRITRDAQYVDSFASEKIPEVAQASIGIPAATQSVIDPESGDPVDSTLAFALYAEQFETAFPEFKLATGPGDAGARAVWAVRMGDLSGIGQGISYAIDSTKPQFFAPAPLSTNLLSRSGVEIFPEGPGKPTATRTFSNVDMDLWGRQFTTAIDKFLSPASAAAAQAKNETDYNRVVAAKGPFADGVSLGVVPVLTSTGDMDDDVAAARETFKQRVLVGAANAYEIETVVQYPVATTNTDPNLEPDFAPNLYGKIRSLTPEDTEANPDDSDYSFSSAKITLQNGGGGNNTNLTFLFDAQRQLNLSSVDAGIGYQISHVEHQIENVPFGGGTSGTTYKSSMWLSLVRPIRDIDVDPSAHVPIALREYPTPPGLKSQTAVQASLNGSTTISNATLWDYTYTYEQQAIAQDTILSNVRFNVGPNVATRGLAQDTEDLFDWLGRFSVEYPVFSDNLSDVDAMESANITWFAELVEGVANAWGAWVTAMGSTRAALQAALEEFQWGYRVDEVVDTGAGTVNIIVHRDAPDPSLTPPRTEARFPDIQLTLPDNTTIVLDDPTVNGDEATYTFDWPGELPDRRVRSLIIDDLDILNVENGWGGIQLARNLNLSAYDGRSTNPSFIYQTPLVRFVNKVTPMIDVRTPINIPDNVTATGTSLAAYLEAMLDALFHSALEPGAKDRLAKIGVRYGFDNRGQQTVAEGPLQSDEVIVELPVLQRMPFEYRPDQAAALAGPLAQEIQEWFNEVQPLTAGGYYDIDFSVFAALSNTQLPVLRVRHLWIGLDQIS